MFSNMKSQTWRYWAKLYKEGDFLGSLQLHKAMGQFFLVRKYHTFQIPIQEGWERREGGEKEEREGKRKEEGEQWGGGRGEGGEQEAWLYSSFSVCLLNENLTAQS